MKASDKDPDARPAALQADNDGDPARTFGRGAEGRANAQAFTRAVRDQPTKETSTRSLRFTQDIWELLEAEAKRRNIPLHALLRVIVAEFLFTSPTREAAERAPIASRTASKRTT